MTQEEIRKLLGGYATNTLTERERAELFEAALDDQELFDALHNEDTLRELLADPIAREQVRQALQPAHRASWMRRPWLIGSAGVAVAAVAAIAIVISQQKPAQQAPPLQTASNQIAAPEIAPKPEAPPAEPREVAPKKALSFDRVRPSLARAAPAPADAVSKAGSKEDEQSAQLTAPPAGVTTGSLQGGAASTSFAVAPIPAPALAALKQPLATGIAANAPLYNGPLVRYSVQRSGPAGSETVRIAVVSELAGSLALYRMDAAGQWQRVFPADGPNLPIAARTTYQIPEAPIAIRDSQEKLRLVIEPDAPIAASPLGSQLTSQRLNEPRAKAVQKKVVAPARLVIEIPIGPN